MHFRRTEIVAIAAFILTLVSNEFAFAAVWRVMPGATGAGTGASWADAYPDLQPALLAASAGDELWVASGSYRPGPPGDRNAAFHMKTDVALRGGFAGVETTIEQRNISANPTILTGDLAGDDGPNFANMSENAYQVVIAINVDDTAILDGFTVKGGRADGISLGATPASRDQGSAVNVYDATPQILNCTFTGNWTINHGTINDHGSSSVINCIFENNYAADHGAGLYIHHESNTFAWNCVFRNNVTPGRGGGGYSASMHGSMWIGCIFEDNRGYNGGGFYADVSSVMLVGCQFSGNVAEIGGGGIFTHNGEPMVMGCVFTDNFAGLDVEAGGGGSGGSGGAGMWTEGGEAMISMCEFMGNRSSFGGGVYAIEQSTALIEDCMFDDNHAREGGGGYSINAPVTFRGCEFRNNTALNSYFSVGGGASTYFADVKIDDCLFENNTADLGGGGQYLEGSNPIVTNCTYIGNHAIGDTEGWGGGILCSFDAHPQIYNCIFDGNRAKTGGGLFLAQFSYPIISNCTLVANTALGQGAWFGGGIFNNEFAESTLSNSIIRGNSPDELGGVPIAIDHCNIEGGAAGDAITDVDPLFRDVLGADLLRGTADDDLRPRPGSPCIDIGRNDAVPAWLMVDRAGGPRFWNDPEMPDGGAGVSPMIDLGAFESRSDLGLAGDLDCNHALSPADVSGFVAALLEPILYSQSHPDCGAGKCDVNADGLVDGRDVSAFTRLLLGS